MKRITLFLSFLVLLSACTPQATPTQSIEPQTLTVMTHDSFAVSEEVVKAFETANNAKVVFLQSGDAGAMLNKAILTKEAPLADVLFGVDNTFLSRALEADIYEPYASPALQNIPTDFKLDSSNRALPVDYGDVCINFDKKYFKDNSLSSAKP
jgi:thiamine transport system substrate-binding protein